MNQNTTRAPRLDEEAGAPARMQTSLSHFTADVEFRSGLETFAIQTYEVDALNWTLAVPLILTLADASPYANDLIPDLIIVAINRTRDKKAGGQ